MAQIAIAAAVSVGLGEVQSLLSPKPKPQKTDVGRANDIRFTTVEEGAFIPKVYGSRVRLAGNCIWGKHTQEHVSDTTQRTGKGGLIGGGGNQTVTETFTYTKSFAILIADALPGGKKGVLLRVTENLNTVVSVANSAGVTGYYEAEDAELISASTVVSCPLCSGGQKVTIPPGSSIVFDNVTSFGAGTRDALIYYDSAVSIPFTVVVNSTTTTGTLPAATTQSTQTQTYTLTDGLNSITITNNHATADLNIDRLFVFPGTDPDGGPTGIIDPTFTFPTDPNDPAPFYSRPMPMDTTGTVQASTVGGGQAIFEFYPGTEDQLQSPTIVGIEGAENTPAYRGSCLFVTENYGLANSTFSNFVFEIDPGMDDLADVVVDLCLADGYTVDQVDATDLAGLIVEGLIINNYAPLSNWLDSLKLWFGFDYHDEGGKLVFKKRGSASVVTIPSTDLGAYNETDTPPACLVKTSYMAEQDLPDAIHVSYLEPDPTSDYHNATVTAQRQIGSTVEPIEQSFPLVSDGDTAQAVGLQILYQTHHAAKPRTWSVPPKYAYLNPSDVVTLALANKSLVERITGASKSLLGPQTFQSVPERAALYNQTLPGAVQTRPVRIVEHPANIALWLADLTPLRLQDNSLGYYVAGAPRGTGVFRGFFLYKEEIADDYELVTGFDRAAMIGVIVGSFDAPADPSIVDRVNTLLVDFYFDDGSAVSRPLDDLLAQTVNVMAIGSGQVTEIIQFADVVSHTTSTPFVARYSFTTLLRGQASTQDACGSHSEGDLVVMINEAVKFRNEIPSEIGQTRNFKGLAVGQALADASEVSFDFEGRSITPLPPASATATRSANGDALVAVVGRSRIVPGMMPGSDVPLAEEIDSYELDIYSGSTIKRQLTFKIGAPMTAFYREDLDSSQKSSVALSAGHSVPSSGWRTVQQLGEPGTWVEANLAVSSFGGDTFGAPRFGLIPTGAAPGSTPDFELLLTSSTGSNYLLTLFQQGTSVYSESGTLAAVSHKYRLSIEGDQVKVYRNYQGTSTTPMFSFVVPPALPYLGHLTIPELSTASEMKIGGLPDPYIVYGTDMQFEDFGSNQASISVRAYQISGIVGRGLPLITTI